MNKKIASAEFPEDDSFWARIFATGLYVTVYFADLNAHILLSWFRNFDYLLVKNDRRSFQDREYLAFTVLKDIDSGSCQIVQGIFDNKSQKIYDARVIQAGSVDPIIKQTHRNGYKKIAFWQ